MQSMMELFERTLMARGRAPNTIKAYTGWVERFEAFVGKSLDEVAIEDLEAYQRHLAADRRVEYTTFNQGFCALRAFYGDCLHRQWDFRRLPFQKKGRRLPLVMTPEEVEALLGACPNIKHRALLMTGYGSGLRLAEVLALRPEHIDSKRMVIWVVQGKWRKDRKVMLPEQLLLTLREYWREYRPAVWLFEGQEKGRPLTDRTVQTIFHQVRGRAGITKRVTFHSLRHSFATHLLDDRVNIVVIQALLGHRSLTSTQIYTHLAGSYLRDTKSPLDRLSRKEKGEPSAE